MFPPKVKGCVDPSKYSIEVDKCEGDIGQYWECTCRLKCEQGTKEENKFVDIMTQWSDFMDTYFPAIQDSLVPNDVPFFNSYPKAKGH